MSMSKKIQPQTRAFKAQYAKHYECKMCGRTKRTVLSKLQRREGKRLVCACISGPDPDDEADRKDGDLLWP